MFAEGSKVAAEKLGVGWGDMELGAYSVEFGFCPPVCGVWRVLDALPGGVRVGFCVGEHTLEGMEETESGIGEGACAGAARGFGKVAEEHLGPADLGGGSMKGKGEGFLD